MIKVSRSHPTWVRGLKSTSCLALSISLSVAPHVGAWIEIKVDVSNQQEPWVAPHVGAWIEIDTYGSAHNDHNVAPHVGAWIEIRMVMVRGL